MLYLGGNPDFRAQGGWSAFLSLMGPGVGIGAVIGVCAALTAGAFAAIRAQRSDPVIRAGRASTGAAIGAAMLWIVVGVVEVVATGRWGWFGFYPLAALVSAGLAALLAAVIVRRSNRTSSNGEA